MSDSHDSQGCEEPAEDSLNPNADRPGHWLDGELGTRRRSSGPPVSGNCRRPKVGVFRWCKRLVVGSVLMVLLLAAALIVAVWFSRGWLRVKGEALLTSELARQRIHLDYGSATYEFTRGLILTDVKLFETEDKQTLLLTCTELGFSFDVVGFAQNRLAGGLTTSFNTRDATVVCFEEGIEVATIQNFRTEIIGRPDSVLVEEFRGRIGDLDFELEGQILSTRDKRRKRNEAEQRAAEAGKPRTKKIANFVFFRELMPWLAVTSREEGVRPEIRAKFIVDHSAEAPVTVSGRFTGRNFNWKTVPLDSAAIEFAFAEGDERLDLPAFNLVYQGGLITGAGLWHSGTNVATVDRFHSAANILGLLRELNPRVAPFAATIQQDEPPLLNATGQLKVKDFWNSDLDIHYRHQSGMTLQLSNGPLRIEGINGRVKVSGGGLETESLAASVLGGAFEFGGRADLSGDTPRFRGAMAVNGLPLQAIIKHFGGSQDLPGLLSGHFNGSGGIAMADLNGSGALRLDAAKLYKVPVIGQVQHLMGSVVPVFGDAEKRSELTADFTVVNGLLDSRNLVILADGTRVEVGGDLNLSNWQTRFEARGNLIGALGLVTGLISKALVVEGSGRVDNLDLKLKHVPAEFASEAVKGLFDVAKGGVGVVSNTVGAGFEGAQNVAGGAIKATGNVLNGGADVVTGGVKAVGEGLGDGARMVGQGAKKFGEGLMRIMPGGNRREEADRQEVPEPDPETRPKLKPTPGQAAPVFSD